MRYYDPDDYEARQAALKAEIQAAARAAGQICSDATATLAAGSVLNYSSAPEFGLNEGRRPLEECRALGAIEAWQAAQAQQVAA